MLKKVQSPPASTEADASDLAERLVRYRSRVEREGRKLALKRIDEAIAEAMKPKAPDVP